MTSPYDDIIHLPHHVSNKHPPMRRSDRAAQFSPFAALTGYNAAVKETARLTDSKLELDETEKAMLNEKLQQLVEQLETKPQVRITYFSPDEKKNGGAYVTAFGAVRKLDTAAHALCLTDGKRIPIDDIYTLEADLFSLKTADN
jgi:hypothetical protein